MLEWKVGGCLCAGGYNLNLNSVPAVSETRPSPHLLKVIGFTGQAILANSSVGNSLLYVVSAQFYFTNLV